MGWIAWLASGAFAASADPLTFLWSASPDQAGAWYGVSVSSAGDVNGDGFDDVIVGASIASDEGLFEGMAYVYVGSATGPVLVPSWTADIDQGYARFGASVAAAGDVNGDGYDDVIVGAPAWDTANPDEGQAYVFLGSATGLATVPIWNAGALQEGAAFGTSVASAGDVNGDGFDDVIVGAELYDGGDDAEGRAYVFHGTATGVNDDSSWQAESDAAGAQFGFSVASAGDINDDGYDDVIVGAPRFGDNVEAEGMASLYLGGPLGLDDDPLWSEESNQASANFGTSVASAGDVNGDGFDDVIVGAENDDDPESNEGKVFVYHGSAWGLSSVSSWSADSDEVDALLGHSVATAGDMNNDGYDDVIVGSDGGVDLYLGSAGGLGVSVLTLESDQEGDGFGLSVASAGDVNGDGLADVIVGASLYDDGQEDEGRAFVYVGAIGASDDDIDGDGSPRPFDCDDNDPTVYPGAPEVCDGKDNACAGSIPDEDADLDDDGTSTCAGDCDDTNAGIHPAAEEVCDGADSNCDGVFDADDVDADGDHWPACLADCDDADPNLSPGQPELCDDLMDNNCDGAVDEECDAGGCSCDGSGAAAGLPAVLVALLALRRRYSTRAA